MKMNRIKFAAAVFTAVFALSGMTAFAQSNAPAETPTETVIEDNRTLTPKGNAQLVDDVSDNENLQFITVTARDGNVFYFVIDKGAQSENVYFLNTVDESDLEALALKSDKKPTATSKPAKKQFRLVYHSCTCGGCRNWRLLLQSNLAEKETSTGGRFGRLRF